MKHLEELVSDKEQVIDDKTATFLSLKYGDDWREELIDNYYVDEGMPSKARSIALEIILKHAGVK